MLEGFEVLGFFALNDEGLGVEAGFEAIPWADALPFRSRRPERLLPVLFFRGAYMVVYPGSG
jgi:hypothetical protein